MSTTAPAPRQLLDRAARRETILRGAAGAFAEKGYAATSMEDVAAAAGITKLIVYRHFASKEALYDAVLERVSERGRDLFLAGLQAGRPASGAVRSLLTVAREDPAGFALLWNHAVREPQFSEHAGSIRARGVDAAEALLVSAGWTSAATGRTRRWAAETIMSYLVSSVLHWLALGDEAEADDDAFVERVSRSLPAMIRAWVEAPS
jgi:AcrR family transcriptional regulator